MVPPKPAPPKPTLQQQVDSLRLDTDRNIKKINAQSILHIFENKVLSRAEQWQMTARNIGSAYTRAAKNHRDALKSDDDSRTLQATALFSILTVLSAGSLSWVWEAGKFIEVGKMLGPVLKDSIMTGMGEVFDNGTAISPNPTTRDAVSQEPLEFQNQLENRVSQFVVNARQYFGGVWKNVLTSTPSDWDNTQTDKLSKMVDSWVQNAETAGIVDVSQGENKSISDMADEIERGFWKTWILGLASSWSGYDGIGHTDYEAIHHDGAISDRLDNLGILREAGVTITRWHEAVEEDRPLMDWANQKYKPRIFTAKKI